MTPFKIILILAITADSRGEDYRACLMDYADTMRTVRASQIGRALDMNIEERLFTSQMIATIENDMDKVDIAVDLLKEKEAV